MVKVDSKKHVAPRKGTKKSSPNAPEGVSFTHLGCYLLKILVILSKIIEKILDCKFQTIIDVFFGSKLERSTKLLAFEQELVEREGVCGFERDRIP